MNEPIDTIRDTFLALVKQGMSPLEAYREFDPEDFRRALVEQIEDKSVCINRETLRIEDQHGNPSLIELYSKVSRAEMNERDMDTALELWAAGWTSETPHKSQTDIFQWFWRRPSRRPGKPGKKYRSTTQAHNALKKEQSPASSTNQ